MTHRNFREDPYVHGVARGLQERYDIDDEVYSYLVYGMEVPVTDEGTVAETIDEAVAKIVIQEPMTPEGVPMPVVVPVRHESDEPFTIEEEIKDVHQGDVVSWYDDEESVASAGVVIDTEESTVYAMTGQLDDDGADIVTLDGGGDFDDVEINGVSIDQEEFSLANDDDEHEKDWWRIDEIEERITEAEE